MACVFVVNEEPQQVETYAFELTQDSIVEVGGAGEAWSRSAVDTRDAKGLLKYRLMQEWLTNPQSHDAARDRAYAHVAANLDQVVPARVSQFESVERKGSLIEF